MRNLLVALAAAIALTGCSSSAITATTPTPVPTPLLRCVGQVADTNGHHAGFTINYAAAVASASPASVISLQPNSITLNAAHPTATIKIGEPGYAGKFAVEFANCGTYLDAKFPSRATLVVSI
jgi:uncharacterized protein YceK